MRINGEKTSLVDFLKEIEFERDVPEAANDDERTGRHGWNAVASGAGKIRSRWG